MSSPKVKKKRKISEAIESFYSSPRDGNIIVKKRNTWIDLKFKIQEKEL